MQCPQYNDQMRIRRGPALYLGILFALCTLFFVCRAILNFYVYYSMRSAEVRVLESSMKIDMMPSPYARSLPYVGYLLRLRLQTTDAYLRELSWEMEAGKATYPEEAFDELRAWAPGTIHKIQFLRGDARSLRIEEVERSPELESAIGSAKLSAFLSAIVILCLVAARADDRIFAKGLFRPWLVFCGFGLIFLLSWIGFTTSQIWRAATWRKVTVQVPEQVTKLDAATLPANVEITSKAKEKLANTEYRVFPFEWNGRTLHGAVATRGSLHGEFDGSYSASSGMPGPLRFHISPDNRWDLQVELGRGKDFWLPFGMFLIFGLGLAGAGVSLRKRFPNG